MKSIQSFLYVSTIMVFMTSLLVTSCQTPPDPVAPDLSEQLERRYCNDPHAVNYNDSFPGIPDNDRCYYPQDFVTGSWTIKDSIYRQDGTFLEYIEKDITFSAISTEEKNTVHLSNWCMGSEKVLLIINKYGKLDITNELEFPNEGQIVCASDTLVGTGFYRVLGTDTSINFEITERKTSGLIQIHKFIGEKK